MDGVCLRQLTCSCSPTVLQSRRDAMVQRHCPFAMAVVIWTRLLQARPSSATQPSTSAATRYIQIEGWDSRHECSSYLLVIN
jgi:hypothetical protein